MPASFYFSFFSISTTTPRRCCSKLFKTHQSSTCLSMLPWPIGRLPSMTRLRSFTSKNYF